MVAAGVPFIVTVNEVEKLLQPPESGRVYFMVYVPAVAPDGLISPLTALRGKPLAGVIEKLPPAVPVKITATGGLGFAVELTTLQILTGLYAIVADGLAFTF